MIITLSEKDYNDLWEESQKTGRVTSYSDGFVTTCQGYVPFIGKVVDWSISLQGGLELRVYDYDLEHSLRLSKQEHDEDPWSVVSFFVSGDASTTLQGIVDQVDEIAERTYLSCCTNTLETEEWSGGQRLIRVQICFHPESFLKNFTTEQLLLLPPEIQQAVQDKIQPYYYSGSMTSMMKTIAHQILACPYSGIMKRFYLEGKALELLTLQFDQLYEQPCYQTTGLLKSEDVDRIYQARDILVANFANPPSLLELARQVTMNDYKLKQGFRQVFGTTVFGYLHDYRLEQAQYFLQSSEMNVAQVAHRIGFVDRSHFAASFRKKFGLNPSQYARQYRGRCLQ